jgi:hypothetical protein
LMSRQQQLNRQFFPALLGGQQPGQQQQRCSRPRSPDLLFSEKVNPSTAWLRVMLPALLIVIQKGS